MHSGKKSSSTLYEIARWNCQYPPICRQSRAKAPTSRLPNGLKSPRTRGAVCLILEGPRPRLPLPLHLKIGYDGPVIASGGAANCCVDQHPMICRVENRIDPTALRQLEAVLKELLRATLIHVSIEIAGNENRGIPSSLLPNDLQHVLGTSVAHMTVASTAIPTMHAPVSVEMEEGAPTAQMGELRPCDISSAPFSRCSNPAEP